jgi:two-component system, LytTR family, response regulator
MSRIRVVLADDETPARRKVRRLLRAHPHIELAGEAASGAEALRLVRDHVPDLLLLDVQMPPPDGIGVARALQDAGGPVPYIIFLTGYDAYAVQAFELHAIDYLLKPFSAARFERALQRAEAAIRTAREQAGDRVARLAHLLEELRAPAPYLHRLLVRHGEKSLLLQTRDIDWAEAAQNYVVLHAAGAAYMIRGTLRDLEDRLDPQLFARIHRSHIVNLDRVRELHPWSHGDLQVVLADGTRLMLSRRYRDRLPALGRQGELPANPTR